MGTNSCFVLRRVGALVMTIALASTAFLLGGLDGRAVKPSQASFPGSNGLIAFTDSTGIHVIEPDGSNQKLLISGGSSPAWSPDGKKIAYMKPHDTGSGIFIADADGSDAEFINMGADPAWSPDGTRLVYMGGTTGLVVYNISTHTQTQITQINPGYVDYHGWPAWQPGGDKIIFVRTWYTNAEYEHYDIWVVNSDGTGMAQLTDKGVGAEEADPGLDFEGGWDPKGDGILFMRAAPDVGIYLMGQNGWPLTLIGSTPGVMSYPVYSPDGNKMAYINYSSSAQPPVYQLHVVEGSNDQVIFSSTAMIAQLDWGVSAVSHEFVVNSTNNLADNDAGDGSCDTGNDVSGGDPECTLLAAVQESNALSGKDRIIFDIPGGGVPVIAAPDGFEINDVVEIDGSTQSGGKVEVNGGVSYGDFCGYTSDPDKNGFEISAGQSLLRGLVIHGYCDFAVVLIGDYTTIEGNYIGTNASGTQALGNGGKQRPGPNPGWSGGGIKILSANNTIGGTSHTTGACNGDCNLISGNSLVSGDPGDWENQPTGIFISSVTALNNTIYGNFIGTDISGQGAPSGGFQQRYGIKVYGAGQSIIGGNTAGMRNVISGNEYAGIFLSNYSGYPFPNSNIIRGNLIGTNAAGTAGISSEQDGVRIEDSWENQVLDNVIASQGGVGNGVTLSGAFCTANTVQGNTIGTAADGTTAIGVYFGIIFQADTHENTITGNTITYGQRGINVFSSKGDDISENNIHHNRYGIDIRDGATGMEISKNTIHHNQIGVWLAGDDTARNTISANLIYDNAPGSLGTTPDSGLGIDLDPQGVTVNDYGDTDSGPNTLLNFPVLGYVSIPGDGNLRIGGTYDGALGSHTYRLEFFANKSCDPSGYGEGEVYLGYANVTTGLTGRVVLDLTVPMGTSSAGQFLTVTATDVNGNTSEFSRCAEIFNGTSMTANASPGATEIQVGSTGGFEVGGYIRINPGGENQEDNQVTGFGSLLLAAPLKYEHSSGEKVVVLSNHLYLLTNQLFLPVIRR